MYTIEEYIIEAFKQSGRRIPYFHREGPSKQEIDAYLEAFPQVSIIELQVDFVSRGYYISNIIKAL